MSSQGPYTDTVSTALIRARLRREAIWRLLAFLMLLTFTSAVLIVSCAVSSQELNTGRVTLTPPCASRAMFDRPCPTCGMTRAFTAIAHGRLAAAWRYNKASIPAYLLFCGGALLGGIGLTKTSLELRALRAHERRS